MSKLTKEQWADIETKLSGVFGVVNLMIDGYTVMLALTRVKNRIVIPVYVNGWIRGEWFTTDCEERRRFMQPRKLYLFKPKERAKFKKMAKRFKGELYIHWNNSMITYEPYWSSFRALKAHLIKNNKSIELTQETKS